jgi:hypothetical protein
MVKTQLKKIGSKEKKEKKKKKIGRRKNKIEN